jgi:penicillin-binding protein 2
MLDNRKQIILFFFFTIGLIYTTRLMYLQIIDNKYQSIDGGSAIRREIQIPLRGQIYDRNGKLMVANVEVYDMYVTPRKVKNLDTLRFCSMLGINRAYFDSTMAVATKYSVNRASAFTRQLSKEDFARIADAMVSFSGFHFEQSFFRTYPGNTMSNALGYIAEIPREQFEGQTYYRKGDYIGLTGIEKQYEKELRGTRGVRFKMMDVHQVDKGSYAEGEFDTLATIGTNLYSSIDLGVQQLADSLFEGKVGGIVAIEPQTGEILAMGSYPTYNPNALSGREFSANFKLLSRDLDKPLINRTTTSFYRPGSTFKIVQAVVGMQLGVIDPSSSFFLSAPPGCHGHSAYHMSNLHNAVQKSCNKYFYHVFRKILSDEAGSSSYIAAREGLRRWHDMVQLFGFGVKLGVDIPGEKEGLLPTVARYDRVYGVNQWKFSNVYSLAIGEGELGVNVLKLANVSAIIANKGYWITPHLVKGIGQRTGGINGALSEVHQTGIESRHFGALFQGMQDAVEQGTVNYRGVIPDIVVCGKTGTSQNKRGKDHSIFIAFAPRDNPKIAIAVVVENGGFGGSVAAPIASLLIEKYIKGQVGRRAIAEQVKAMNFSTTASQRAGKLILQ